MEFRAAVLHKPGEGVRIETAEVSALRDGDVLVRMRAAGLCHTDLEVIDGQLSYPMPIILGHEAAGVVERVGAGVTRVGPGDHVVLSWNPHCGHCFYCEQGQPILCETYLAMGQKATAFDGVPRLSLNGRSLHNLMFLGAFAEYCIVSEQAAVKVPADIPFDRACVIGCGVMTGVGAATRVAPVAYGSSVAVIGCGAVGLNVIQGARMAGAGRIIAIDREPARLTQAQTFGATHTIVAGDDTVSVVRNLTGGRGADYVFEAAGSLPAFALAPEITRPGGHLVLLGKVHVDQKVGFRWGALMGEMRIIRSSYGGARPARDFPQLAQSYLDGALKLDELITYRIRLDEINEGFELMRRGDSLRVVVEFPG